jgi:hypothetical protein
MSLRSHRQGNDISRIHGQSFIHQRDRGGRLPIVNECTVGQMIVSLCSVEYRLNVSQLELEYVPKGQWASVDKPRGV